MWLCVHDPADAGKVVRAFANWPTTHWEFDFTRHGSPVLDRDVLIVSRGAGNTRFPLFVGLESADFVMFYFEGDNPEQFGPGQHHVTLDQLPQNLRNASAERAVVAIELTSQNPHNTNAVQRMGRIEDHTNLGIPFLYVSPIDSIRLKTGAGISGNHGDDRLIPFQRICIRNNTPTEEATLAGEVIGACPFSESRHPDPQGISGWTEQCLLIHGDSNQVNTAHLTLPRMWSCIHDSYRYSGSQLTALYEFMRQVMDDTESSGIAAGRASSAWTPHISATRERAAAGVNVGGRGTRHDDLRSYGQTYGYPMGAIRILDDSFDHYSEPHHYESRAQRKSLTAMELGVGANNLVVFNTYCSGFTVNQTILSQVINAVGGRHFLLSRYIPIKPKTKKTEPAAYLNEDTYTGSMHITDWLFTREPASHWDMKDWPRAVSNDPRSRLHIFAVEGPWTSAQANYSTRDSDVYGRRTRARIDLYRCTDGVYIGQPLADLIGVPIFTPLAN